ncbi:MAG: T9SS type A sorting domain-containing protein [bacterium]
MKKVSFLIFSILVLIGAGVSSASELKGNEFILDTSVTYGAASGYKRNSDVAFDGVNYFAVWQDSRSGFFAAIYGARISPAGVVFNKSNIPISLSGGSPGIAFDGENYLVIWQDYRNVSANIYGTRIRTDGSRLDTNDIPIWIAPDTIGNVSIAFGDTVFLIVWQSLSKGIHGVILNRTGVVLDTLNILAAPYQVCPSVAFDGDNFFVVWSAGFASSGDSGLLARRVSLTGDLIDTSNILITPTGGSNPSVTFGDTNYFTAWSEYRSGHYGVYGARISKNGVVLDKPTGKLISNMSTSYNPSYPSVASNGTNYLVTWQDSSSIEHGIRAARIGFDGSIIDTFALTPTITGHEPSAVSDSTDFFIVARSEQVMPDYCKSIYGTRVGGNGTVIDTPGILLSISANGQQYPSVAFDGTNYLGTWVDYRSNKQNIYGTRVSADGNVLDEKAFVISPITYNQKPSLIFGDSNYFVVWSDSGSIYGSRVDSKGIVLDTPGMKIYNSDSLSSSSPSISFDGQNYFVVWNGVGKYPYTYQFILGARVNKEGVIIDTNAIQIALSGENRVPLVAFDGVNYLVVWQNNYIYGVRINSSGVVIDTIPIQISTFGGNSSISFGKQNYLVVWTSTNYDIYGARVDTDGTLLDTSGIPISTLPDYERNTSVAFDGENYIIVWEGHDGSQYDIHSAKVSEGGAVINATPFISAKGNQYSPVISHGDNNRCLVLYSGIAGPPYGCVRTWGALYEGIGVEEKSNVRTSSTTLRVTENPFIKSTVIKYFIPVRTRVILSVYDISGSCVKTLVNEEKPAGSYNLNLNAKELKTGIYFVRLTAGSFKETRKLVLMK